MLFCSPITMGISLSIIFPHYHLLTVCDESDHFDQKVEASLRRDLPIITTPHARNHLSNKGNGESFTDVFDLDPFQSMFVDIQGTPAKQNGKVPKIKVTGMPGKHVPGKFLQQLNDLVGAIPPTNGWMVELGYGDAEGEDGKFESGYRFAYLYRFHLMLFFTSSNDKLPGSTSQATH